VIINFICQLDWIRGAQVLDLLFLGISVRAFSDEIRI
jgi:hypothetical protein